jgi:hypothetical protein
MATVTDSANASQVTTGRVSFSPSFSYLGTFSNQGACALSSGSCGVQFTPADEGSGTIPAYASCHGGTGVYKSSETTYLYVTPKN